jgi:hypothetical protein
VIAILYSPPGDLDISGTPLELTQVQKAVLELLRSTQRELRVEANTSCDPRPYKQTLAELIIRRGTGPVLISVVDTSVVAEGDDTCLEAFASWFVWPPDAKFPAHGHYEYFEGNEWIATGSIPLVIGVRRTDGSE